MDKLSSIEYTILVMTINEQNVIKALYFNSHISMREIARTLGLAGATSAAYVINSLEKKGYIEKVGTSTSKEYRLTNLAMERIIPEIFHGKFEQIKHNESSLPTADQFGKAFSQSFASSENTNFGNGSAPISNGGLESFLSHSIPQIINNPVTMHNYGEIVIVGIFLLVGLPISHKALGTEWLTGFTLLAFILSVVTLSIIILKKYESRN